MENHRIKKNKYDSSPIHTWHLVIGGFRQKTSDPTGMLHLFKVMHALLSGPNVQVIHCPWDVSVRDLAEQIRWCSPSAQATRITVAAYSWGVTGARNLSKELRKRGYRVESVVCADGVYRHWYWLGQWRAMVPWTKIVFPPNVEEVSWFVQKNNLPRGHQIIKMPDAATPYIHPPIILDLTHGFMDESEYFHNAAIKAATGGPECSYET